MEQFITNLQDHVGTLFLALAVIAVYAGIVVRTNIRPNSNMAGYFANNQKEIHSKFFELVTDLFLLDLSMTLGWAFSFGCWLFMLTNDSVYIFIYMKELFRRRV